MQSGRLCEVSRLFGGAMMHSTWEHDFPFDEKTIANAVRDVARLDWYALTGLDVTGADDGWIRFDIRDNVVDSTFKVQVRDGTVRIKHCTGVYDKEAGDRLYSNIRARLYGAPYKPPMNARETMSTAPTVSGNSERKRPDDFERKAAIIVFLMIGVIAIASVLLIMTNARRPSSPPPPVPTPSSSTTIRTYGSSSSPTLGSPATSSTPTDASTKVTGSPTPTTSQPVTPASTPTPTTRETKKSASGNGSGDKKTEEHPVVIPPKIGSTSTPTSTPTKQQSSGDIYYKNCTAVWNAVGHPLHIGDPGYRDKLDRDSDGIACELDPRK